MTPFMSNLDLLRALVVATAVVAVPILLFGPEPASADVVIMHNGDRMTGDLIRQDAGRLKLKTAYAGTLDIDWEQVSEVRLDEPQEVLLDDERVLQVRAVSREDDRLTLLQEPPSEPMTVEPARVKVIEPEPWELGEGHRLNGRVNFALKNERGNSRQERDRFRLPAGLPPALASFRELGGARVRHQ